MAKFGTVNQSSPAAATTQNVTIPGFGTPDAVIAIARPLMPDGVTSSTDLSMTLGVWDGTTQCSVCMSNDDNLGFSDSGLGRSTTHLISSVNFGGGTLTNEASITATVTDGVTVTWATTIDCQVEYIFIRNVVGATAQAFGFTASTSSDDFSLSHEPHLTFFFYSGDYSGDAGVNGSIGVGLAHWDGTTTKQEGFQFSSYDNSGTTGNGFLRRSTHAISEMSGHDFGRSYAFSRPSADTIRLTRDSGTSSGNEKGVFLSLELNDATKVAIGKQLVPQTTGDDSVTGLGFYPGFILGTPSNAQNVDSIRSGDDANGFAISTYCPHTNHISNSVCNLVRSVDGVGTSQEDDYTGEEFIKIMDWGSVTDDWLAKVSNVNNDGWTLNYTTATALSSRYYGWLAVASDAAMVADTGSAGGSCASNVTTFTPGIPSPIDVGDLMVFYGYIDSARGIVSDPTSDGWTAQNASSSTPVYTKIYEAGDTAPTLELNGGEKGICRIARVVGNAATDPIDDFQTQNGSGTTITCPAVTTSLTNGLILCGFRSDGTTVADAVHPAGTGQIIIQQCGTVAGPCGGGLAQTEQETAGSSGTFDWSAPSLGGGHTAWTLAIKSAGGVGPGITLPIFREHYRRLQLR